MTKLSHNIDSGSSFSDNKQKRILLGQLGSNGDCLHATTIARQIKSDYPNCHLTWAISSLCRSVIENNPFVDEIWEIPANNWNEIAAVWSWLEEEGKKRLQEGKFDEVFLTQVSPDNYQNYDGTTRVSLYRGYPKPITVPVQNILRLKNDEIENVRLFAEKHNLSKRSHVILFEYNSNSSQSFVTPDYALFIAKSIVSLFPDCSIILSSHKQINTTDERIIDGSVLSLRENAELTKYCSLFIGCSSGVTQTVLSDWAKQLPMVQLLLEGTSVYASIAHDLEYWGYSSDQVLEMTDTSPQKLIDCISLIFTRGFAKARHKFHEKINLNFNFYLMIIRAALLSKGKYIKTIRSILNVVERYGWHEEIKKFVQSELMPTIKVRIKQNQSNKNKKFNLLSVIVPWWDHTEFLELWKSNLPYLPDCEIIFIDNGSKEKSKQLLEKFCHTHNIKLIRNEENRGFAAANNQGLAVAMGDYILHLNNDISIKEEVNIKYLCDLARECIVGPGYTFNELNIKYVEGWALCAKKSVLNKLGGWNEIYGPGYWEDVDLCYRAQLAGHPVVAIPAISEWIEHITNATGRDGRIDQIALHLANRKKFIDQYFHITPKIIIDGVFFQMYRTGIARVWRSLLEVWAENGFAENIIVLDRVGTAPKVGGVRYRTIPAYDYNNTDADRQMLQQICDEEGADIFISTYYTTPISTPSVFMGYDMIPEVVSDNSATLQEPMWREKHYGINHALAYITISENTKNDLIKFFPEIVTSQVQVAHCGIDKRFTVATASEVSQFKNQYGITKPYFLLVGAGSNYKNAILFFQAFAKLSTKAGFDIICTGSGVTLANEYREYTHGTIVHSLMLSDEELRLAYAGAIALVYPSKYEGFGMPVAEAMACGCPVITCPNSSLPEVAGEAAIYVNDSNVDELVDALCEVQKPSVRNSLITAGLAQSQKFSWQNMAEKVSQALIQATLLRLNLREINLIVFPDWSQSEEVIFAELSEVIKTVASHPDQNNITVLIDNSNIAGEEADLILSSILMNLMMEEEIDVTETLEIVLIGELSDVQWQVLIPKLKARIILELENQEQISQVKLGDLMAIKTDDLLSYNFNS